MNNYILIILSKNSEDYSKPIKTWRCVDIEQVRQIKECVHECLTFCGYGSTKLDITKQNQTNIREEHVIYETSGSDVSLVLTVMYFPQKHFINLLKESYNAG